MQAISRLLFSSFFADSCLWDRLPFAGPTINNQTQWTNRSKRTDFKRESDRRTLSRWPWWPRDSRVRNAQAAHTVLPITRHRVGARAEWILVRNSRGILTVFSFRWNVIWMRNLSVNKTHTEKKNTKHTNKKTNNIQGFESDKHGQLDRKKSERKAPSSDRLINSSVKKERGKRGLSWWVKGYSRLSFKILPTSPVT